MSNIDSVSFDESMYSGFIHGNWQNMNEAERLSLLQDVANQQADGQYTVIVSFKDMACNICGYQSGNRIYLNRDMFARDKMVCSYNGKEIEYALQDSNWQALETVLHEGRHVYQDMVSAGIVKTDASVKEVFDANGFTVTTVNGQRASQYMFGKNNYAMYYLNPTELDAYKTSQDKTEQIITELKNRNFKDLTADLYLDKTKVTGYKAQLSKFIEAYNNENIAGEVEQVLKNAYYGTDATVDEKIKNEVHSEMIESQKFIDNKFSKEPNIMSKQTYSENGFTYTVDENGTITAEGKIEADNGVKCGTRVTPDGMQSGDQRGHIIAARAGGVNKSYNMTAQNGKLNMGAYKTVEKAEVDLARKGYEVQTSKTAYVSNQQGGRPDAYMVNDTITTPDGKTQVVHMSFQNMSPQEQQDMNDKSEEAFALISDEFPNPNSRPEGMTEKEYTELMDETDRSLLSVKDEFDADNTTSASFTEDYSFNAQSLLDAGSSTGEESTSNSAECSTDGGADAGADGSMDI